uniref:Protein tas n=1 Tax=Rhizophora mucronata TaxID=61149 RepID=A0A2P2MGH1_RHIMU
MSESTSLAMLKCIRCLSGPRLREGARNTLAVGLEKGRSRGTVLYWRQRWLDLLGKWPGFEAGQSAWIPGTSLRPLTVA